MSLMSQTDLNDENRLLVRVEEAGQMLGLSRAKSYAMVLNGEMPGIVRIGRNVRISVRMLRSWVKGQEDAGQGGVAA
jgi:excisionase family DNA binding protein